MRLLQPIPLLFLFPVFPCQYALQAAGTFVRFQPGAADTGPYPTDFLTIADTAQLTGIRVNLPQPDCAAQPATCMELAQVNQLDGFNLAPRLTVRFSGPVNAATLRDGISVVWLDPIVPGDLGVQPRGHATRINRVVFDPQSNTMFAEPDEPLDQQRRYLLVVTSTVKDSAGDAIGADPAFTACIASTPPNSYCAALEQALRSITPRGNVIAASRFTTLSATAFLEKARTAIQASNPGFARVSGPSVFHVTSIAAITYRQQVGANPSQFQDTTIPFPAFLLGGVNRIAFASFQSPSFLDAARTIPAQPTGAAVTLPASEQIQFHVLLPSASRPASGYPVIIFGHGLNDSSFGAPTLVASRFAQAGFAVVAMNAVGHGSGPDSTIRILDTSLRTTVIPSGGRSIDLNGDGIIDSREGCIILTPLPVGLRDCIRQTALDLAQLVRVLRSNPDLEGDGSLDLDPDRIYYAGQSLGALYGTVLHAIEPQVRAAVLNVGGGSAVDIARLSPSFRFMVRDYLAARKPPLLNIPGDFNDNLPFRDEAVRVNQVPGAIEIQDLEERLEWFQMGGDPLAFAPHIRLSPLTGLTAKPALFQFARGDRTVPNPTNTNLVRWAGMQNSTTLYRHDIAKQLDPSLDDNPHSFLIDITSVGSTAIAAATQGQITDFFASGGATVPTLGPILGVDLFQTPAPVLEDLGFGPSDLVTVVSAASYRPQLAPGSIASGFGDQLATDAVGAKTLPLPASLADTTVRVTDSAGASQVAGLYSVAPGQVNFLLPENTAPGTAEVVVTNSSGGISTGTIQVRNVAPAIFTANQSGSGVPAAFVVRQRADGTQVTTNAFVCASTGACTTNPIDLSVAAEQVVLELFGTGIRGRSALSAVSARIGGIVAQVLYAGAQAQYAGLDQVNILLPRELAGHGAVEVNLTVDGLEANPVTIQVR